MKEYLSELLVEFPQNKFNINEFDRIVKIISLILDKHSLQSRYYLDSRSYTFSSLSFIVFVVISEKEYSPVVWLEIASSLKNNVPNFIFSNKTMNFDLNTDPNVEEKFKRFDFF